MGVEKGIFYMAVGIPGSGKSTYGAKMKNVFVVCPDSIRKELYGDESIQGDGKIVFEIAYNRILKALSEGKDVYFDATNVTKYSRRNTLDYVCGFARKCIAIYFDVPFEKCKTRNKERERVVPEFIIDSMARRICKPSKREGFSEVWNVKS